MTAGTALRLFRPTKNHTPNMFPAFFTRQIFLILVTLFAVASVPAAPPKITRLSVRGLQTGGTTTVTIQGRDLLPEPTIVLGVPIKQQQVLEKATETKLQIAVTLDANVTPGIYNLRLTNRKGISSPLIVAVDSLPQMPLKENVDAMPVALHGTLTGSAIHTTSFAGKAGQEITIEVESQRIGAKLRPVLRLYDANRRQIAASLPMSELAGDTRLITKLPADGKYTVEVNDLQYATPAPGDYRLKIGSFNYADAVFPPAVARGKPSVVELIGNFPNTNQAQVSTTDGEVVPAGWPSGSTPTGLRPRVIVSDIAELIEDVPQATPQSLPAIPSAVSGRLSVAAEEDVYQLKVTEGDKLRFEVFAARIGSPLDAVLEVRNEKGGRLAQNDDAVGPDPRVDYTVPKNVPVVHVAIKDAHRRGGDRCIYRLVVTRVRDAAKTGFRLTAVSDTYNIAPQNSHLFQVRIERQGYDGPIQLTVAGLPAGMKADPVEVPAGATGAIIALQNQNKMEVASGLPQP